MKREWTRAQVVFGIPLTLFFGTILLGAYIYTLLEGWNYLDAVYFAVSTATTLGYGDFVPVTAGGKIFTILFAILVISLALYFFTLIGKYFIMEGKKRQLVSSGRIKHHRGIRRVKV
jgi:voltage-gated potassium channel